MGIAETPTAQHWNYFLALEDDVAHLSRFLEPTTANFGAYSLELARILFAAASEVDVVAKCLCAKLDVTSRADNINAYRRKIMHGLPVFASTTVEVPRFGLTFHPWEEWGSSEEVNKPFWWKAYNNVKHHRDTHFNDANLKHALNAVAGLFVLLLFFYRQEAHDGQLRPDPRLFRAGPPFKADKLAWGDGTVYRLVDDQPIENNIA